MAARRYAPHAENEAAVLAPEELKACARRVPEEVFTQGDLAVADAVFAPDVVHHGLPGCVPGVAGIKQCVHALRRALPDFVALVEDEVAEADRVAQRLTVGGARGTWHAVTLLRLDARGRVVEYWVCPDLVGLPRRCGAPLPKAVG